MSTYILRKGVSTLSDLKDGGGVNFPLGTGNVYYVMQAANPNYGRFLENHQWEYSDGTTSVHNTIQAAIDACTTDRNDYVVVMPDTSDYDITAVITIAKSRIHIIAAGGITGSGIPSNSVRIHQNTATTDCFQITLANATCVEIAGFFFKCAAEGAAINLGSVTTWHANIHDNFVGIATSAGAGVGGIVSTGAANHSVIWRNYINGYAPATTKTVASFISLGSTSTRYVIEDNVLVGGSAMTIDVGIKVGGSDGIVRRNVIQEGASAGGATIATFSVGIAANFSTLCYENIFMMAAQANAITGGTALLSRVNNYEGTAGGTLVETA